jgi:hypothetical protein
MNSTVRHVVFGTGAIGLEPPSMPCSAAGSFQQAGQPRTRLRQIKPWMIRIAALTNRTLRELPEMQYQFEEPFIVDSSKITNTLGARAMPVEKALADTLATYRSASNF